MSNGNPFQGPQPNITEYSRDDSRLTNHQRVKDREMQRAFDAQLDIPFLPTSGRLQRWGYSRGTWIRKETERLKQPPEGALAA